jgi:MFS family permease
MDTSNLQQRHSPRSSPRSSIIEMTSDIELNLDEGPEPESSDSESDEMLRYANSPIKKKKRIPTPYPSNFLAADDEDEGDQTELDDSFAPLTPTRGITSSSRGLPQVMMTPVLPLTNRQRLEEWLFPSDLPHSVQLFRKENIVIPLCYFIVGALQGFSGPLMNVYPIDLGASEAQQVTIVALRSLPASFKLIFGFISDTNPLWGYRRKSYMALGWGLAALSMFMLLFVIKASDGKPAIPELSLLYFLFGLGFWFADVMADSVVAEKAKLEPVGARGSLQSSCYGARFFALMICAPISTYLYSWYGPTVVIWVMALLPSALVAIPLWNFVEDWNPEIASVKDQCKEIWKTVCSRAVWQPMGFVYLYNCLQIGNGAWKQYLRSVLNFSSEELNWLLIISYVLLYLGVMFYKYYLIKYSWRKIYYITTSLNFVLSMLQVFLLLGVTFGLSNFLFALGDDAMAEFINGIQFLPTTIMMVNLCPTGSEGASYAMFTTGE